MFYGCSNLVEIDFGSFDVSKVTVMNYPFAFCSKLTTVTGVFKGTVVDLDLRNCPLTNESAMIFINGLGVANKTITFKASTYNTLTDEQKAIATNKGWTIAKV